MPRNPKIPKSASANKRRHQRIVRALVVDGWEFDTALDAALHIVWLLQRLSYYEKWREGQPADGFRFRQGIIAGRKLLKKLNYKVGAGRRPNK